MLKLKAIRFEFFDIDKHFHIISATIWNQIVINIKQTTYMWTRIMLFLATNIAVIAVLTISSYILSNFFWINIWNDSGYLGLLAFSAIIWFAWSFISLALSRWSAKRAYNIVPVKADEVSGLNSKEKLVYETVQQLAERNNITMPEVGFYESAEPNAFATWASKNKSLVAVSSGLMDTMSNDAVEWVVAHEMAHVLNWDMVTMTLLQWVVNTFVIFAAKIVANIASNFVDERMAWIVRFVVDIALQILFGMLASIITMKFSRYREFKADAGSARYVWKEKMIAGLKALQVMTNRMVTPDNDALASMKIASEKVSGFKLLFASHPPLEKRIEALENLIIN